MKLGITDQPVAYSTLVQAAVNVLVVLEVVHWTPVQVAAVNAVLIALLGVFVFQAVTPTAHADAHADAVGVAARNATLAEISTLHTLEPPTVAAKPRTRRAT